MLAYDQEAALQSLRSRRLDIKMKEMQHYTNNLGQIAGQCAMLAGFSFKVLSKARVREGMTGIGTVPTIYEGIDHVVELLYVYFAILSMMFNVIALCVATFASMLGPDLGLRGGTGSMEHATTELRKLHSWVASAYILGLYCFMAGIISWSWVHFYMRQNSLQEPLGISATVLLLGMVATGRTVRMLYSKFDHPNQLPLGPFQFVSKKVKRLSELAATIEFEADFSEETGGVSAGGHGYDNCSRCGAGLRAGTQFCPQCGLRYTFKAGVATSVHTNPKQKQKPAFFEVVSGAVRRRKHQGGQVQAEVSLAPMGCTIRCSLVENSTHSHGGRGGAKRTVVLQRIVTGVGTGLRAGKSRGQAVEAGGLTIVCQSEAEAAAWKTAVEGAVQQQRQQQRKPGQFEHQQ